MGGRKGTVKVRNCYGTGRQTPRRPRLFAPPMPLTGQPLNPGEWAMPGALNGSGRPNPVPKCRSCFWGWHWMP